MRPSNKFVQQQVSAYTASQVANVRFLLQKTARSGTAQTEHTHHNQTLDPNQVWEDVINGCCRWPL